ncbi:MAG TPA: iron-containing alcohol dehydrogenase [Tepidisphaeraceae bacterium]|nr:iron-containing alcohol dehydrogenase [Tepidisphaeraceae bacterium]
MSDVVNFEFVAPARIVFGSGHFERLGELAGKIGRRALIVFNGSEPIANLAKGQLSSSGLDAELFRQRGEPTVNDVDSATEIARNEQVDLVVGLGGGSAIDAAKAVAALVANGGSALDYMEVVGKGQRLARASIPWIAIPTTFGTGAEATKNAVIGAPARGFKASIRGEQLLAKIVLVDPALGRGVPSKVIAQSGMDAVCQLIESYTSNGAGPMTDGLATAGLKRAPSALRRAYLNGQDLDALTDMALAALLSGICLANAGLGAVHGFAAPLGANFPIPHGAVCAALLPYVVRANVAALRAASKDHPILRRYADIGRAAGAGAGESDAGAIEFLIQFLFDLSRDLHIQPLGAFGVEDKEVDRIVALARKASSMRFNPIVLDDTVLASVLRDAIAGA